MMNQKELLGLEDLNFESLIKLENSFSGIKFFEKDHHYEIDGERAAMSVSQLISKYEKPFDNSIAHKVAKKNGRLVEDVLWDWEFNKDYSCHKGSEFHLMVEQFFQRRVVPIDKEAIISFYRKKQNDSWKEDQIEKYYNEMAIFIRNFKNFYEWWQQDHILLKSEFVIGDKDTKICGTIDNLSYNKKTKKLALFDYKTNKEIKRQGFKGETMLSPIDTVPKCELGKYSLQLSLYKLILEKNTGFEVGECGIVWVAGQDDYELINILDVEKEAKLILN